MNEILNNMLGTRTRLNLKLETTNERSLSGVKMDFKSSSVLVSNDSSRQPRNKDLMLSADLVTQPPPDTPVASIEKKHTQ